MYPRATETTSPRKPTLSTSWSRITSMAAMTILVGDVREKRHLARALHGDGDLILMAPTRARDPARADLAPLRDVAAKLVVVLVVDLFDLLFAEVAALPPDRAGGGRRPPTAALLLRLWWHAVAFLLLKRNIVVGRGSGAGLHEVRLVCGHVRRRDVLGLSLAVAASAQELDRLGDDLDGLALRAVLRLPLTPVQPSIYSDRPALREVLRAAFPLVAPDRDVEVIRLVAPFPGGRVLLARVHGQAELADRRSARGVPELGVLGEVPDQYDSIDVCHGSFSFLSRTLVPMLPGRGDSLSPGPDNGPPDGHVPQGAVRDLEHARDLRERFRIRVELKDVVVRLALVLDLVGKLAPAPGLVPKPAPAALLDQLARAREDLVLALLRELRIEHEHDLVCVHGSRTLLPSV